MDHELNQMPDDQKSSWHTRLNQNERRIVDVFVEFGLWWFIPRPLLEERLCKTKLMNSHTLTDRLDYLIAKGILGKLRGDKGAVYYAPGLVVDRVLNDPFFKPVLDAIDGASPKKVIVFSAPRKPQVEHVSEERMSELLVRAAESWERIGVGSERSKSKHYQELRRLRRELKLKAEMDREPDGRSP